MITIRSQIHLERVKGLDIFNFLVNATDREYQRWWPGTHFQMHTTKQTQKIIGNVVYMHEMVGHKRLKMTGVVVEAEPGRKITWQLKKLVMLPVRLCIEFEDNREGVTLSHTITAGMTGIGKIFDLFFRMYFSRRFEFEMDAHFKTEFVKLRDMLLLERPA